MKRPPNKSDIAAMDISDALRGWEFESGQVNVRLIRGRDGKPKLQLRLDLGLLQMELDGRPDGKRPHRSKTELDFQQQRLRKYEQRHGDDDGFALTPAECQALREESAMFYHRYLSLFVLEQYPAVIRDTQHNLNVLDLCHKYGRSDHDRLILEQYRPYILMMHTRARACEALRSGFVQTAVAYLRGGIKQIARLYRKAGHPKLVRRSHEVQVLLEMARQIRHQLPVDPRQELRMELHKAVQEERYEDAAMLRDKLQSLRYAQPNTAASAAKPKPRRTRRKPPQV